jgi:hypothetical protein
MRFYLYDHFKSELRHGADYGKRSTTRLLIGQWEKTVNTNLNFLYCFLIFFTVFPTDQSEAELLYFYSLFFSVKKPFQKTKVLKNGTLSSMR